MSEQTPSSGTGTGNGGDGTPDELDERAPRETGSDDPVTLDDRTAPGTSGTGYSGSPVGNQGTAEPVPATPGHPDPSAPLTPPSLEDMNVGAGDPQLPRHPAAAGSGLALDEPVSSAPTDLGGPGTVPSEDRPVPSAGVSTGRATGPEHPTSSSTGTAHRAPGMQGSTGPDEALETDVVAGAARMGPASEGGVPTDDEAGDAQSVPSIGGDAMRGTSEEHGVVRGARTPSTSD